tara:strand:- start:557 stop:838 length:282 start_codon:yes stop_codon:yes gene_type:complete
MPSENKKISFTDLDGFLKFAPIIGIGILAYLQTLFPSKVEFEKLEDHLIQMDKKITEITILQKDTSNNTAAINSLNNRLREIEIELAKHQKNQ